MMLVFWKQKLVFLAVPKTGTTALEAVLAPHASAAILGPPGQKHASASKYRKSLSGFFEQRGRHPMQTIAVMREPIDWLGSWYRYRRRPALIGKPNSTDGLSFEEFVQAWLSRDVPPFADVGSQANFLNNEDGTLGVDQLYSYENFEQLVGFWQKTLNIQMILPKRNVSPVLELQLNAALRSRLQSERPGEFDLWDRLQTNCPLTP
jgi:hypothetical protein